MRTLIITVLIGAFGVLGCSETKDSTENKVTDETPKTEQPGYTTTDESSAKEKAGEEPKADIKEKDADIKLKVKDSKLESASFTAESMHCTGCESSIENNVKKLDGVQDVKATFDTKQIEVTFSGDKVTKKEIADAITASGFECKINE